SLAAQAVGLPSTGVQHYIDNAKSANTRKAYRIDWDDFTEWCRVNERQAMPASPETVADYLAGQVMAGWKAATIKRRLSSISMAHRMRGYRDVNPAQSEWVKSTMQGIRRAIGVAQVQKSPLVTSELAKLVRHCEQLPPLMAARDRALLLIGTSG